MSSYQYRVNFSDKGSSYDLFSVFSPKFVNYKQVFDLQRLGCPVQPLFLSVTEVPKDFPCPSVSQQQDLPARAQLAHLLSRLRPGLPRHSLMQPASEYIYLSSLFAPNLVRQVRRNPHPSEESATNLKWVDRLLCKSDKFVLSVK